MNSEEKYEMMKLRVLHSFKWEKDITIPLSEEFGISKEEFEDILMNRFDMSDQIEKRLKDKCILI